MLDTDFQFYKMKTCKDGCGDGWTTLWMYLVSLNCILDNDYDGQFFMYVHFLYNKSKKNETKPKKILKELGMADESCFP